MKDLVELFVAFFKVGSMTFGGGLSMLPMLEYELVKKREWISSDTLLDCYAIGQCTPGIIAVNTATFIGYKRKGILGAIFATMGMITPSILIILIVATFLEEFITTPIVAHALAGIKAVVCALMLHTIFGLVKKSITGVFALIICFASAMVAFLTDVPTIIIIISSALIGILVKSLEEFQNSRQSKGGQEWK